MWFDGTIWKITDETGGGKLISMGSGTINDKLEKWPKPVIIQMKNMQRMPHSGWPSLFKVPMTIKMRSGSLSNLLCNSLMINLSLRFT